MSVDSESIGETGVLDFSATQAGLSSCLAGCPIEGDLMVGGTLDVLVSGGDPDAIYDARILPAGAASVSLTERFSCTKNAANGKATRETMRRDECAVDETLETVRTVAVTPVAQATFTLQIVDDERVVDAISLTSTDAARVVVVDPAAERETPIAEPLVLGVDETIPIAFTFRDAVDQQLLVHRLAAGATVTPRDGKVELAFPVFGALTAFSSGQAPIDLTGKASGATAIVFTLPGRQLDVPVTVE